MKKIIIFILCFFVCVSSAFAKTEKNYSVNFDGEKYSLLYSKKDSEMGGFINEYYRLGETYNIWTKMIAIHHFPNAYSPIDQIKNFKNYLNSMRCPSSMTFDDKNNAAMIDFLMIHNLQGRVILEFNVFKYQKSPKCGSIAIQYAQRYIGTNAYQVEDIKREFEKNRKKIIKKVKSFNPPQIVSEEIDKCKVESSNENSLEKNENKENKKELIEKNEQSLNEPSQNTDNNEDIKPETSDTAIDSDSQAESTTDNKNEVEVNTIEESPSDTSSQEDSKSEENEDIKETTNAPIPDIKESKNSIEETETLKDNSQNIDNNEIIKEEKEEKINNKGQESDTNKNNSNIEKQSDKKINKKSKDSQTEPVILYLDDLKPDNAAPVPEVKNVSEKVTTPKAEDLKNVKVKDINKTNKELKNKTKKEQKQKNKKIKKEEEKTYQISNTKDDFYAKPIKRKKISPKKAAKLRAKEAKKKLAD